MILPQTPGGVVYAQVLQILLSCASEMRHVQTGQILEPQYNMLLTSKTELDQLLTSGQLFSQCSWLSQLTCCCFGLQPLRRTSDPQIRLSSRPEQRQQVRQSNKLLAEQFKYIYIVRLADHLFHFKTNSLLGLNSLFTYMLPYKVTSCFIFKVSCLLHGVFSCACGQLVPSLLALILSFEFGSIFKHDSYCTWGF